ncbi:hypothetical protein O0L34_g7986 [Tuta absoluta]|nr:hypothetical protein O0L34_g7986 [Tuta absoluta]
MPAFDEREIQDSQFAPDNTLQSGDKIEKSMFTHSEKETRDSQFFSDNTQTQQSVESRRQRNPSMAELLKNGGMWKTQKRATPSKIKNHVLFDDWQVAGKNKKQRKSGGSATLTGKMGKAEPAASGNCRAADSKAPIFITNVSKETKESDIVNYILSKTNQNVTLQKIYIKNKWKDHCAYKMFVSKLKVGLFLDEKLWPEGIIFRRFVCFNAPRRTLDGGARKQPLT